MALAAFCLDPICLAMSPSEASLEAAANGSVD
jgi:hypothetical protein